MLVQWNTQTGIVSNKIPRSGSNNVLRTLWSEERMHVGRFGDDVRSINAFSFSYTHGGMDGHSQRGRCPLQVRSESTV